MLKSRNLDNQTFDEIMEFVLGRLPWAEPGWTDYNAHDPGITILELMAWYKEMQQFHMNAVTEAMLRQLLKLVGTAPSPARAARCFIELPAHMGKRRELGRLETDNGIPFELVRATGGGADVEAVYLDLDGRISEVTDILTQPDIALTPFPRGSNSSLYISISNVSGDTLRLWFEVDDRLPVKRNPFISVDQKPRIVEWSFAGTDIAEPIIDETHALSLSGYVELRLPEVWDETIINGRGLKCVNIRLSDPGCEEDVRLNTISASRHEAAQHETWSSLKSFTAEGSERDEIILGDALSVDGLLYAFIRADTGLKQLEFQEISNDAGRTVVFDGRGAVIDGAPNIFIVSADAMHVGELIRPSTGLPDMRVELLLGGRKILTDRIGLICDAVGLDGSICPALWRYVDDLRTARPSDRVFSFDFERECLVFGDGEHGCIVPRGDRAILIAPLVLSYCGDGNIPEGRLRFTEDTLEAANTAAFGGKSAQSVGEAGVEFLRKLEDPLKCASEKDYERAALLTPGLRVAAAKAVAGYDPDEPTGRSRIPVVSIIAVPYSSEEKPMPDARFLNTMRTYIESLRPICTKVKVIAPRYVPVGISLQVKASAHDAELCLREAARQYLELSKDRQIGEPVVRNDLMARLMELEGIYKVERLELRQLGADCYTTAAGDIQTPRNAIAYLSEMEVTVR